MISVTIKPPLTKNKSAIKIINKSGFHISKLFFIKTKILINLLELQQNFLSHLCLFFNFLSKQQILDISLDFEAFSQSTFLIIALTSSLLTLLNKKVEFATNILCLIAIILGCIS